ncbi:hypothetical protein [Lederbergia graminis]|uniref:Uncharacterized protein n=1 Tax=Lederbergia graminis TaxID=735518 RepID=A0ABW0LHG1_9BACI
MIKRGISLLLISIFVLGFSATTFAAYESPQWSLRSDTIGDWGWATAYLGTGTSTLYVTVNQSGIHAGEKAHTFWEIYHPGTAKTEQVIDIPVDFYATLIFDGLNNPGGQYEVFWESKTNNDTQGWYQLHTTSGSSEFYRRK